jgi:hypothetical protein
LRVGRSVLGLGSSRGRRLRVALAVRLLGSLALLLFLLLASLPFLSDLLEF